MDRKLEPYKSKNCTRTRAGSSGGGSGTRASSLCSLQSLAARCLCSPRVRQPESLFSLAGNIITKNRCSLNPAVAQDLIFLSANRAHWGLADLALVCEDADYGDAPNPADQ